MSGKLECFTVSYMSILSIKIARFQTAWDRFVRLSEANLMASTVLETVGLCRNDNWRACSVSLKCFAVSSIVLVSCRTRPISDLLRSFSTSQ
jgi:hypothetical protein